ncbi:hypothetical protein BDV25DRAFT_168540 [Aspergillus avenaceus]|uniref:Zn(2)-C6 fungal-type domain-containing protein n=1 Tax=Aspergillus avenaceus TaxID=36643 RepID=A0A5N6TPT6_ASPAV|nr:hypothetical protein BDV25DRAFT_168540 [Aspergillus avenaceus]
MAPRSGSHARVSRSCGNCRPIKRRCDRRLPHCGQCIRMREPCPGYRDEWDLVFRNQTDHTIKRSKEIRAKRDNKATVARGVHSDPHPSAGFSPNPNEIGVNYFFHYFVTGCQSSSRGYLNYIPAVWTADGHHPTLVASIAAVGLVTLANTTRQPTLAKHARAKYTEAIEQVNLALASPTESIKDSTLMSVISLGLFEHVSNFVSWARHIQGAAAVVAARGKCQFATRAAILMFNQVRADMVAASMYSNQPFPAELEALQEEAAKYVDTTSVFWRLGVVATQCTKLLWVVKNNRAESSWLSLLEQANSLQRELDQIFVILSTKSPYTIFQKPGGNPAVFYRERFDLYTNIWAIRVWNNTRILQIKVCDAIRYILNHILVSDLNRITQVPLKQKLRDTMKMSSKLGEDMMATVPQVLGMVSSASETVPNIHGSFPTNGSAGYMMTWSLYTAAKSSVIDYEGRKWIVGRLQDFGHVGGITLALQLAEDIINFDRCENRESLILLSGPFKG